MSKTIFPISAQHNFLTGDLHKQIIAQAAAEGLQIYVVGGILRDQIWLKYHPQFKNESKDVDYAIAGGSAFVFAKKMAALLNGHFVALDEKNDTARVVMADGFFLDFAGCIGGSIEQDILRRDFTVNSLYLEIDKPNEIIDLTGGICDIKSGVIRSLQSSILADDPLRLLRAFRFAASLQFTIESQTFSWIKNNAQSITTVAGERISSELFSIFALPALDKILLLLTESGLLENIFPELKATRAVTGNVYHHLNLFDHSLETSIQAEKEYASSQLWTETNLQEEISFTISRLAACKIACLLHDIGKPATWVITEEGKHTFIGHERLGEQMIVPISQRLRWSKHIERFVAKLVRFHLRPGQLFHHMENDCHPSQKGINRLFRQAGADFPALILLALGDLAATKGPLMTEQRSSVLRQKFYDLLDQFYKFTAIAVSMEKLLDGHDVMRLLEIPAGKNVGQILLALREAQEFKKVANRSQAEDFVRFFYEKQKKK